MGNNRNDTQAGWSRKIINQFLFEIKSIQNKCIFQAVKPRKAKLKFLSPLPEAPKVWLSHVANEAKPVSFIKVYSPRPLNSRVEPSHRPAYCRQQCRRRSCRCQCLRCLTSNSSWKLSKKVTRLSYSSKIQNRRWLNGKLCILWKARRVFQPPTTKKYKR